MKPTGKDLRGRIFATLSTLAFSLGGADVPRALAVPGDIHNLGTLGGKGSWGYAINDSGQVAGSAYLTGNSVFHAFRYTGRPGAGGEMADLGTLGDPWSSSYGQDINETGEVAGFSYLSWSSRNMRAFRYTGTPGAGGAMADLGTLGGFSSYACGINNAGQVAGDSYATDNRALHAFLHTGTPGAGGVMADLGTFGGSSTGVTAVNDSGQVTGHYEGGGFYRAFVYIGTPGAGGAMVGLGTLGGAASESSAINESGQIAGNSETPEGAYHAFRYTGTPGADGTMVDLGTLGGWSSYGIGINDAGFVVGRAQRPGSYDDDWAALWLTDAANTAVDLDAWLDEVNPNLGAYWELREARDINNNGLITGYGFYNDGPGGQSDGQRAFILDASSLIPEPNTLALAGLAALALLRKRPAR